jgi:hypothetical protein
MIFINSKFTHTTTHTSTRTSSIEIQPFSDYVKSNSKENTYGYAQGRNHWHGSGDV